MANTGPFIAGLTFTVTLFTAGQAPAAQDEARALVLHVDNYAELPPSILARAEVETARVYAAAGVRTTWVHGDDEADARDAGGLHLRVLLLCGAMTNHKTDAEHIGTNVLGRANRQTARAYIFTPRVVNVALQRGKSVDLMIGRIMAHEIGHLLLHEGSHSATGIMREQVNLSHHHFDTFTMPQAAEIQWALNR